MRRTLASWLVVGVALAAVPVLAQAPGGDVAAARDGLRLSIEEWRREDAAYRAARGDARLSSAEAAEYAAFVAGLRLRVLEQCEVVRRLGGEEAVRDVDCLRRGGEAVAVAVVPAGTVLTDEEKKQALEARLSRLESEIDGDLQKRQQEIRQTGTGSASRGTGAAAGAGTGTGAAAAGGGSAGAASASRESGRQPGWSNPDAAKGASGPSGEGPSATGGDGRSPGATGSPAGPQPGQHSRATPSDSGSDDDVVARQLREAAEKESDPVLKEKLWAEYRKYREAKK